MSEIIQHYEHGEGYWYSQEVKLLLDADGEPIALGDTVWDGFNKFCVVGIGDHVWCRYFNGKAILYRKPERLVHENPDNWKLIILNAMALADECNNILDYELKKSVQTDGVNDLIDRCKALAGEDE